MIMTTITTSLVVPTDIALNPPAGVLSDWNDPYTLRPYNNVTVSLALVFTGIFIILRFYTKIRIFHQVNWEDCTCLVGFIGFVGYIICGICQVNVKGGTHQWNVTDAELQVQKRIVNIGDMIYAWTVLCIKFSLILFMLRLFCSQKRDPFYWILQSLNAVNTIFYFIFFIVPIVQCSPRAKIWDVKLPGECLDAFSLYIASAALNTASDIAMFFVPLWRIWHLNISRQRKLGVSAIFFFGFLAIIASIVRLMFVTFLLDHVDYSYVKIQSTLATYAELAFGLIASCLFVLPRLYRHLAAIPPFDSEKLSSSCKRCEKTSLGTGTANGATTGEKGAYGRTTSNKRNDPSMDAYYQYDHQQRRKSSVPFTPRNDFFSKVRLDSIETENEKVKEGQDRRKHHGEKDLPPVPLNRYDSWEYGQKQRHYKNSVPFEESEDIVEEACAGTYGGGGGGALEDPRSAASWLSLGETHGDGSGQTS